MHRICLTLALFAATVPAQKFEVASIKPNHAGDGRTMIGMHPGGRFRAENVTVKQLINMAYNIREYQVSGLPGWADSEHYNIDAKPEGMGESEGPPTRMPTEAEQKTQQEKLRAMMRDLLAERFGLKIHRETKELPVYALVVAKSGFKLAETDENTPPIFDPPPGGPHAPEGAQGPIRGRMIRMGRGQLTGQSMDMTMLSNQLSSVLGRSVVDKTGLTGRYDIKLSWTPDEVQAAASRGAGSDGGPVSTAPNETGPSLFTAIQEQIGLKLDSQKAPVEIVAVDHIEKATEN